ncbi:MAG: hypothetical protein EHM33_34455 [Chloroflexi bacterium]|nr:MAG: hypothetical protein EHM33_34455 [Chloroflexota bacterium]
MKKHLGRQYTKPFLAWAALFAFSLLAFVVLIAVETLTRKYPESQWWINAPVNVFSDAFVPVTGFTLHLFSIPLGFVSLLPVLSYVLQWKKAHRIIEILCYILSISLLWFGFWLTGWAADCQMLSLQSDGGPWGPCGYWAWFSRPLNTFIWHTILWIIWSVMLVRIWTIIKRKLLPNGESFSFPLQAA